MKEKLYAWLHKRGRAKAFDVANAQGLSLEWAYLALRTLEREGKVECTGYDWKVKT